MGARIHQLVDLGEDDATSDVYAGAERFFMENPPHEKRANAFAVMFLAPKSAVIREVGPARPEGYGLDAAKSLVGTVRSKFGVGPEATAWHLHNLGYIKTEETVRALLREPEGDNVSGFETSSKFDGLERRVFEALSREIITVGRASELLDRPIEPSELVGRSA